MLKAGGPLTHWTGVYSQDEQLFLQDYARVFQRVMQLGAVPGAPWALLPEQYIWLGINGTATNYGTEIMPLNSSYDKNAVSTVPVKLEDASTQQAQVSKASSMPTCIAATLLSCLLAVLVECGRVMW
jgi:hypothetical protein